MEKILIFICIHSGVIINGLSVTTSADTTLLVTTSPVATLPVTTSPVIILSNRTVYMQTNVTFECHGTALTKKSKIIAYPRQLATKNDTLTIKQISSKHFQVQMSIVSSEDEGEYCCLRTGPSNCTFLQPIEPPMINMAFVKERAVCSISNRSSTCKLTITLEHFSFSGILLRYKNESELNEICMDIDESYCTEGRYKCKIFVTECGYVKPALLREQNISKYGNKTKCLEGIQPQHGKRGQVEFYIYGYQSSEKHEIYENDILIDEKNPGYEIMVRHRSLNLPSYKIDVDVNATEITVRKLNFKEQNAVVHFTLRLKGNAICNSTYKYHLLETDQDKPDVLAIYILSCCGCVVFFWILTLISSRVNCQLVKEDE